MRWPSSYGLLPARAAADTTLKPQCTVQTTLPTAPRAEKRGEETGTLQVTAPSGEEENGHKPALCMVRGLRRNTQSVETE